MLSVLKSRAELALLAPARLATAVRLATHPHSEQLFCFWRAAVLAAQQHRQQGLRRLPFLPAIRLRLHWVHRAAHLSELAGQVVRLLPAPRHFAVG